MATIHANKQEKDCIVLEVGGKYYPYYVGYYGEEHTERSVAEALGCVTWEGEIIPVPILRDNDTLTPDEIGRSVGDVIGTLAHEIR